MGHGDHSASTELMLESIRHWHGLAEQELRMAEHERRVFGPEHSVEVRHNKAMQFRGVAATIMLELLTGEQWCACRDQLQPARLCESPAARLCESPAARARR